MIIVYVYYQFQLFINNRMSMILNNFRNVKYKIFLKLDLKKCNFEIG